MSAPDAFSARDRARRIAWRLEKVLQERRLAWRGEEVGMTSLSDDADQRLADLAGDAEASVEGVVTGVVRDRERGMMEIPFAVALATVAAWIADAAGLERARRDGRTPDRAAQGDVERLLEAALERLEAFVAAYDAKTPLPPARPTSVARALALAACPRAATWDREPPSVPSDRHGLVDLLVALGRALAAEGPVGWRVEPPAPGRGLRLATGATDGPTLPAPAAVARAADVLRWVQPVEVSLHGGPDGAGRPRGAVVVLRDAAGERMTPTLEAAAGSGARLAPAAAEAVRALLAAPAPEPGAPPAPSRLVALLGVLRALDAEVQRALAPGLRGGGAARAAREVPREPTRKAPVRRALLAALGAAHPALALERVGPVLEEVARGRVGRTLPVGDAAALLLLLGRAWAFGGARGEAALPLAPLSDADVVALAEDLLDVAAVRRDLEAGRDVGAGRMLRLERAAIGALGRLGRIGAGGG